MLYEQTRRRPSFVEGARIRLADGQTWSLPDHPPYREDEEHIALLRAIGESEDDSERARGELALAILLLSHNYDLSPADYQTILDYPAGDPELVEVQRTLHAVATKQSRALRRMAESDAQGRPPAARPTHWSLGSLLRPRRRHKARSGSPGGSDRITGKMRFDRGV
jgi:hypothetical protein